MIQRSRDAQRRPCRLEPKPMQEANAWIERYRALWERTYERLDVLLAEAMKTASGRTSSDLSGVNRRREA